MSQSNPLRAGRILACAALLSLLLAPQVASAKKGFFFGFGFGGAIVDGETGVPLNAPATDPDFALSNAPNNIAVNTAALFSTAEGEGFAATFRLGYNILGFVSIEVELGGSGNNLGNGDKIEGQLGVFGLLRFFPAQLFKEVADRWWDPYVMIGAGGYTILYNPQAEDVHPGVPMRTDGRAWGPGAAIKYGFGCDFYVAPFVSLGVDLAFINGFHSDFRVDFEDDIRTEAIETTGSFVFQPTARVTFHFGTD
jgi:hypothetical protein